MGSGTTAAVATKLNRRFIVADQSPVACALLRRRQLGVTSEPTLTDSTPRPLTIRYPVDQTPCRITTEITEKSGKPYVQLKKTSFSGKDAAPIYAATGYVEGACFHAVQANSAPKLPILLPLVTDHTPVLHVVGVHGEQAFFTIE